MALEVKYCDERGEVRINMTPEGGSRDTLTHRRSEGAHSPLTRSHLTGEGSLARHEGSPRHTITTPTFDTINHRFGPYELFGGKYEASSESSGSAPRSLFRSRYNSVEEELANTPYAFTTRAPPDSHLAITLDRLASPPSPDIGDERLFRGARTDAPAFTVTQLIHAQDRYYDLSARDARTRDRTFQRSGDTSDVQVPVDTKVVKTWSAPTQRAKDSASDRVSEGAFTVLNADVNTQTEPPLTTVVPVTIRKREKSFAILPEPAVSRPSSPRSLPLDLRLGRVSPFRGRGFREETSRHNTPRASADNSRANSPPRRRTNSLSRIDKMASTATLPPPIIFPQLHPSRNFLKENIEEIRELSELNREKNEAEAERKMIEEEAAILKEMGLTEKEAKIEATRSVAASRNNSRTNSRSNSPSKINLRSRSNSPSTKLSKEGSKSREYINASDGLPNPVTHRSRIRSVSKSQPQSNDGSPKHSKIPKRQSSASPNRTTAKSLSKKDNFISRRPISNLNQNQKYMSNSTSSIHETIRIGSQIHDKRGISQSAQHLSISPAHIRGKPPISPGRVGPPPSNRTINPKRLSPIVGTPNKSPIEDLKTSSAKNGVKQTGAKRPVRTTTNSTVTSKSVPKASSRSTSREPSPDKRKTIAKTVPKTTSTAPKTINRTPSSKSIQKPSTPTKTDPKKSIARTDSTDSLNRASSTKNLAAKPPLKRSDSKLSNKSQSIGKVNDVGRKDSGKPKGNEVKKEIKRTDSATDPEEILKQDSETQYDKITNEKGELVIMTKKNIVSMTTAAITSQPLEVVTTVTNQLPAALEKAREKRNIERLNSKESLTGKEEDKEMKHEKVQVKVVDEKKKKDNKHTEKTNDKENQPDKSKKEIIDDSIRLKLLQPPFNDPQLEKVKQKIDDILKTPEISRENILTSSAKSRETKFKNVAEKAKTEAKETKDMVAEKLTEIKNEVVKQQEAAKPVQETVTSEIRQEATKIVDSIITPVEMPVEHPKDVLDKVEEVKKSTIEPIITVVNEKKKEVGKEAVEKVNETLVKGDAEVEVQSSNVSTPRVQRMAMERNVAEGNGSDKSLSNGGFPQSTSTTPKPPARTRREQKEKEREKEHSSAEEDKPDGENGQQKKTNICSRLMGKCKTKCCPCCIKGEDQEQEEMHRREESVAEEQVKQGMMSKFSCCKKKTAVEEQVETEMERAVGKGATIEYEDETKRRKWRDVLCCCGRRRRVADGGVPPQRVADVSTPHVTGDTGCCGGKRRDRRDSILSDRPPPGCCSRLRVWCSGMCRRAPAASRRASVFSKNKSLSPTLPPEDTRKKLDPSLVEHSGVLRAAIPVLPTPLAYFCLAANVLVPGLGTILSGLFCVCFGIPRFGVHDGAKYRLGALVVNILVGAGQLFTVLFCLVGWGWAIWWGVIMVKLARKYKRLRAAAAQDDAPPVTQNNHARA